MKNFPNLDSGLLGRRSEQRKTVSPRQYLNLSQEEKERVGHMRIVVPKLGDALAFGGIELIYK